MSESHFEATDDQENTGSQASSSRVTSEAGITQAPEAGSAQAAQAPEAGASQVTQTPVVSAAQATQAPEAGSAQTAQAPVAGASSATQATQAHHGLSNQASPALEALVVKAIAGDREALISLCTEIARGVLYRSLRALDNPLDAEDAAQEILLRVCNKISDLNDPKAFNGWLNSIIINETRRIGSKSAMQVDVLDISDYLDEFEEEQEDFLPMEFAIKEEDRKAMIQVIDKLPVRQREAVVLHYYEGFSVTEVAGMMGVTHQGVSRYLKLAREKVKSELSQPVALPKATVSRLASLPAGVLLALTLSEDSNQLLVEQAPLYRDLLARIGEVVSVIGVTAVATKISWAMLRRVAMAVFATVTIAFGAWVFISVVTPQPPDTLVLPAPALEFGGRVQFSGGNPEDTRINPNRAVAAARTTDGDMVALNWWITTSDSETILYNGDGGVVSSALTQLQSDGKSGEYLVHYRMQDVQGDIYTLSASFLIE